LLAQQRPNSDAARATIWMLLCLFVAITSVSRWTIAMEYPLLEVLTAGGQA